MTKTINWWPKPHIERIDTSLSFWGFFCSNIYLNIFLLGGGGHYFMNYVFKLKLQIICPRYKQFSMRKQLRRGFPAYLVVLNSRCTKLKSDA